MVYVIRKAFYNDNGVDRALAIGVGDITCFSSWKKADREREISTYGKVISMRPTKVHNPKNEYKRAKNKKINLTDEDF